MKKIKNIVIGGIQQKVFNLVLFTIILMMAVNTVVVVYEAGRISRLETETNALITDSITTISQQTMDGVLHKSLTQSTRMQANIADDLFADTVGVVRMLADYAGHIFADPSAYSLREVSPPDPSKDGEISVQLLTEAGVDVTSPATAWRLGLIGNMADMMTALYANANVDSCYVALPSGVMLLVDDHAGSKFDENGAILSIPIRERQWYIGAVETGGLYFTDVTTDVFTGEISIMCSLPVYQNGRLAAVIGADLFLNDMAEAVDTSDENGGFVLIVNENGHVVLSPRTEGVFSVRNADEAVDLRASDNAALAGFIRGALEDETDVCLIEADGESCYMVGAPIETVGWAVVSVVPKAVTDQPTVMLTESYESIQSDALTLFNDGLASAKRTIIVLILLVVLLGSAGALTLSKRIVRPLETITRRVRSLGGNDIQFNMEPAYRTGDEIEVLAESFAALSAKTVQYIGEVARVSAEKERIGTELALATRIQADMLPNIYPAFPERTEFDVYATMDPAKEVGGDFYDFFLVDDDHLCVVMADVSGKGVPAALFMMASKIILQNNAMLGKSPAQILTDTNAAICSNNREEMFVTVWLGILELSTGHMTAANAGHEYPVLRRPNGMFELVKDRHGFVIGGMEGVRYKEYSLELEPGAKLFLYTDGVPEATDAENELFDTSRMLDALNAEPDASTVRILEIVREAVDAFVRDAEQFDDLTMLCLKYIGPGEKTPGAVESDGKPGKSA